MPAAELSPVGNGWKRFEATLTPTDTDTHATLTISFRGPGTLWIDQVSLMPTNNVFGWRTDVAEALKALKPGIIRFGGTAVESFEWTATIGDPAKRVPFTTCWGGLEPGNAGLEEFVQAVRVGRRRAADLRAIHRQDPQGRRRPSGILQRTGNLADGQTQGGQRTIQTLQRQILADRQRTGR